MTADTPGNRGANESAPASDEPPLEFRTQLRTGGWVGVAGDTVFVDDGGERVRIDTADVLEASYEDYDSFLAIVSLVLVGFGLWFVVESPLSVLFSLAGVGSLYLVYRRRDRVELRVRGRAKPLTLYPEEAAELHTWITGPAPERDE